MVTIFPLDYSSQWTATGRSIVLAYGIERIVGLRNYRVKELPTGQRNNYLGRNSDKVPNFGFYGVKHILIMLFNN